MLAVWGDLPTNTMSMTGRALFLPVCKENISGRAFFIADNTFYDFEETLEKSQDQWMGPDLNNWVSEGIRRVRGTMLHE